MQQSNMSHANEKNFLFAKKCKYIRVSAFTYADVMTNEMVLKIL